MGTSCNFCSSPPRPSPPPPAVGLIPLFKRPLQRCTRVQRYKGCLNKTKNRQFGPVGRPLVRKKREIIKVIITNHQLRPGTTWPGARAEADKKVDELVLLASLQVHILSLQMQLAALIFIQYLWLINSPSFWTAVFSEMVDFFKILEAAFD